MIRAGASFYVKCRARGHDRTGRVHDLTPSGCLLDAGNGFAGAGDLVALRFDGGTRVTGRATLLHGRIARIEFERPLHDAVFDHLTGTTGYPPPVERSFWPTRGAANGAGTFS